MPLNSVETAGKVIRIAREREERGLTKFVLHSTLPRDFVSAVQSGKQTDSLTQVAGFGIIADMYAQASDNDTKNPGGRVIEDVDSLGRLLQLLRSNSSEMNSAARLETTKPLVLAALEEIIA